MRRLLPLLLCLLAMTAATLSTPLAASAQDQVLDKPRRGADAVRALGDKLPAVARAHDTTAAVLRARLEGDDSLWVDVMGRLFYVDPVAPDHTDEQVTTVVTSTATPSDVFALNSKADAARTVYLDFDGVGGTYGGAVGGAWDAGYTGGDGVAEPYTLDGDYAFSDAERAEIYSIWQRVAEDFAPFDVNVTTHEPSPERIDRADAADTEYGTRVAMTSTETTCGCGGVAYVGVFDYYGGYGHAHYQPAFVYNDGAKNAAEAASHEAGHNLGLSHDGTRQTGYYKGHGDWAPIMGVGYYEPITQWSRGEYSGANNKEDDFAVAGANGAPLRADAAGTALDLSSAAPVRGIIETAADVDDFTFSLTSPLTVTVDVDPAGVSPNLDIKATLHSSSGVIATSDPLSGPLTVDSASGLDAHLSVTLDAGSYTVSIEGVGAHDPSSSGYSDYGSVGSYSLTVTTGPAGETGTGGGSTIPPAPDSVTASLASSTEVLVSWTDVSGETAYEVGRQKKVRGGYSTAELVGSTAADALSFTDTPGSGTFRYVVRAKNDVGTSAWSTPSGEVSIAKTTGNKATK